MGIGLLLDPYGEKSPGGLGRAIFEMVKALLKADHNNLYTIYVKKEPATPPLLPGDNWTLKVLGESSLFLHGARYINRTLDVHIFFNPIIPLFFFPKKSIVVVHDFAYLELPNQSLKQKISAIFLYCAHAVSLRKATTIVAVSEATKQSTVQHFRIHPNKIQVIYNGFVFPEEVPDQMPVPQQFFLFAGVLKERKNVAGIIKAFGIFARTNETHKLLIAGKNEGEYAESLISLARGLGIENRVPFLGYVTNAQLAYLYSKAEAFVFPSFIEGFGMPILEAMHVGLPVITSNSGALAEIAGDAALLVDPTRPEDIAEAMSRIVANVTLKTDLIEKGLRRSAQFSWDETARRLIEVTYKVADTKRQLSL